MQHGLPEQPLGDRHRHRADAADLAQLLTVNPATTQGRHINP
jgi:hypothetical protein